LTFFTVIVATLNRPTLRDTLNSLRRQMFRDFEVLTWTGGVNEYEARNLAAERAKGEVLAFIDDDAYAHREWLKNAYRYFQDPEVYVLTGPVEGDCFGWGVWLRLSHKYWGIGTNMFVRKWVFHEVGGFEVNWGLKPPVRGWRSDTDLTWRILDRYGEEHYVHAEDVLVYHPRRMQSVWEPRVEGRFYLRHRARCLRIFAPVDPRLCSFIVSEGLEGDDRVVRRLLSDQKPRLDWMLLNSVEPILDVGSGEGLTFIPHASGMDVVHLDVDVYSIENFVRGDGLHLPFRDKSFNTVCLGEVLEHVSDPLLLLREAVRVAWGRVVATVPYEQEWGCEHAPMLSREERMVRDGFRDVDEMAKHYVGVSPYCRGIVSERVYPHLWHVRWFTKGDLEKMVGELGCRYVVGELRFGGWVFHTLIIHVS
jgi:glycosyltransferase involved in cell wall biosynthesis